MCSCTRVLPLPSETSPLTLLRRPSQSTMSTVSLGRNVATGYLEAGSELSPRQPGAQAETWLPVASGLWAPGAAGFFRGQQGLTLHLGEKNPSFQAEHPLRSLEHHRRSALWAQPPGSESRSPMCSPRSAFPPSLPRKYRERGVHHSTWHRRPGRVLLSQGDSPGTLELKKARVRLPESLQEELAL